MKTLILKIIAILIISSLFIVLTQCKKDKSCKAVVTVKYYHDTTMVVDNAEIQIKKGDVKAEGFTNANGIFEHTFKYEAILDIFAEKDTTSPDNPVVSPPLTGAAVIRLQPGKTIEKTVFIQ